MERGYHHEQYIGKTGSMIIYEKLVDNGVKLTCGITGGAVLNLMDIFDPAHHNNQPPIQFITNSNESNCGYVCEGYAKASGKLAVTLVTSGPGLTNIITPLQDAFCDGVPMIAISGQVPTTAPPEAFQAVNAIALTKTCTKWNHKVKSVAEIPEVFDYAFYVANTGRPGPVHIDIPRDLQVAIYTEEDAKQPQLNMEINSLNRQLPPLDNQQLENIVRLINIAETPILYVGQGAIDCKDELLEFVNKTNIPVTTTIHALGVFDERHPLSLKMVGMHGHATANFMIQKADLILAVGSRFDDRTIGNLPKYAPVARKAQISGTGGFVHVDIRPSEKNKIIHVNEFVNTDCKLFLRELNKLDLKFKERNEWLLFMKKSQNAYPIEIPFFQDGRLSFQKVVAELDKQIEPIRDRCVFTTGVGCHQMVAAQLITWTAPRSIITSGSLGTMGVATGFAIGAKLALPDTTVIAIDGDGSFNMTSSELKTIMDLQIPVKIIIMNNSSLMMVYYWQKLFFGGRSRLSEFNNCDYNKLADAYGIYNIHCDNEADLSDKLKEFLDYKGPVLLNAVIEKTPSLPLVLPQRPLDDMILHDDPIDARKNTLSIPS